MGLDHKTCSSSAIHKLKPHWPIRVQTDGTANPAKECPSMRARQRAQKPMVISLAITTAMPTRISIESCQSSRRHAISSCTPPMACAEKVREASVACLSVFAVRRKHDSTTSQLPEAQRLGLIGCRARNAKAKYVWVTATFKSIEPIQKR